MSSSFGSGCTSEETFMYRSLLFTLVSCSLVGCQPAGSPITEQEKTAGDPAIKYYKGPADGRKVSIHLQSGFKGEHVILHYDNARLYDGDPKTKPTLGRAEIVTFTIGKEESGKITIQTPVSASKTFTWEKSTYIGISIGVDEKREVHWKQQVKEFIYD